MAFKITEAQARSMAWFESEAGCEVSAGPDYGIYLGDVMALALHPVDREKFVDLLCDEFGTVLSAEEIEEVASSFQTQVQERIARKLVPQQSA
jgi:hypothetical protein